MKDKFIGLLLAFLVIGLPLSFIQKCQKDNKIKKEEREAEIESEREAKVMRERSDSIRTQLLIEYQIKNQAHIDSMRKLLKEKGIDYSKYVNPPQKNQ